MTGTSLPPLYLPVDRWPGPDRDRWRRAKEAAGFLEPDKPASRWSPARCTIVETAYGTAAGTHSLEDIR